MSEEHTPTLQDLAADRDWWLADAGKHYRELAHWRRGQMPAAIYPAGITRPCPTLRCKSRSLRRWFALTAPMIGETHDWALWAIAGLLALMMLLPLLNR
jgi:hypothetical protein